VLVSEFAPLVSGTLAARQDVATLFLIVFSLAIAAGSVCVNLLLKGEVSARWVPLSALGLAAGLIDLWIAASGFRWKWPVPRSGSSWRPTGPGTF
jgi:acyl-[acyl-carrier-protein]-phospholipid O-acyltransferase/long-chain-fatty-acid--[acyl-carrier-protein] ligase